MSTIQVPSTSFWSMLPGITQNAVQTYQQSQDRARQQMLQQLGILQTQAQQGANVNPMISELMSKLNMPGVTPAETPQQLATRIGSTPDIQTPGAEMRLQGPGGTDAGPGISVAPMATSPFTDEQRKRAGMPTAADKAIEAGNVATAGTTVAGAPLAQQIISIKQKKAAGQEITPQEASIAGIKTIADDQLARSAEVADFVKTQGPAYVDEAINGAGGRIRMTAEKGLAPNAQQLTDTAYQNFIKRFGNKVPPEEATNARQYFAQAVKDQWDKQNELDLKKATLDLQLQLARVRKGDQDPETAGKIVTMLNGMAETITKRLSAIPKGNMDVYMMGMMNPNATAAKLGSNNDPTKGPAAMEFQSFIKDQKALQQIQIAQAASMRGLVQNPETQAALDGVINILNPPEDETKGPSGASSRKKAADGRWIVTPQEAQLLKKNGNWNASQYVIGG